MSSASPIDRLPRPVEMIAHLDTFVRGQAKAKLDIANAVYNHYIAQAMRDRDGVDLGRHHILIIGPTGSGKTHIVRTLANFLGFPVSFASATALVGAGYVGRSPDDMIRSLIERVGGDARRAERGIIFIDEIDKIRRQNTGGGRDISGEAVQNALLTMLDGRIADSVEGSRHAPVDTSRILFVCTGAFVGLQSIVQHRLGTDPGRRIGFRSRGLKTSVNTPDVPIYEALCQTTTEDLVAFGFIPELIGRFATITALHELGHDDLRALIDTSIAGSPLERQTKMAEIHGIRLTFTPDALQAIVDRAVRMGTGARGLPRLLGMAIDSVDYRWGDLADDGVTDVIFDRDAVLGDGEPRCEKGNRTLDRLDDDLRRAAMTSPPSVPGRPGRPGDRPNENNAGVTPDGTPIEVGKGVIITRGNTIETIRGPLEQIKKALDWDNTSEEAARWWTAFEKMHEKSFFVVLHLATELQQRKATVTEFYLAFKNSMTDDITANLHYLDYLRLKRVTDENRKGETPPDDSKPTSDAPADGGATAS